MTTAVKTKNMTMMAAIHEALDEALTSDPRVFLLGEDIADPSGGITGLTRGLSTKHGHDRVLDTPISEAAIVGAAIGAALEGQIAVAEIMMMDFLPIAMDQIVNLAAKARFMSAGRTSCPLTVRTATYGGSGIGATHSQSLEAWFMHVPGLKVIIPSSPADAKGLLKAAIFDADPCLFIETRALYASNGEVPVGDHVIEIGQAAIKRGGRDVTVVAYGRAVVDALVAAEQLAADGIEVEVLDLRTLVPLDMDSVRESVSRTGRAVVAHYATRFAGPGAEVAASVSTDLFSQLRAPVERVGARFRPIPFTKALESAVLPDVERIVAAIRATMGFTNDHRPVLGR